MYTAQWAQQRWLAVPDPATDNESFQSVETSSVKTSADELVQPVWPWAKRHQLVAWAMKNRGHGVNGNSRSVEIRAAIEEHKTAWSHV
jgi:hypothetical protein